MADSADACKSCSKTFDDIKSAIRCSVCESYFHGNCEGITDLRGFHMKRASWKCSNCNVNNVQNEMKNRGKRYKSESGDVVEVDRLLLENILSSLNNLTTTVEDLKKQVTSAENENKKLREIVSNSMKINQRQSVPVGFSYAAAAKSYQAQVNTPATDKIKGNNPPFIFDGNSAKENKSSKELTQPHNGPSTFTADQVKSAIEQAVDEFQTDTQHTDSFQSVKPRRKKIQRPIYIGSRDSSSGNGSSQSTCQLFEGTERRHWIYVGRVKAGINADSISEYVKQNWDIDDILCYPLAANDGICSFKIGVRESHIPSLLNPTKWPKGVAVREFVYFPKRGKTVTKNQQTSSGNFPQGDPPQPPK